MGPGSHCPGSTAEGKGRGEEAALGTSETLQWKAWDPGASLRGSPQVE